MPYRAVHWVTLLLPAFTLGAQRLPITALPPANASFPQSFSDLTGLRELRDRRLLVVDQRELTVLLLDMVTGRAEPIGRRGPGPGEYQWPTNLHALPGDSSALQDNAARLLLIIGPDGRTGDRLDAREQGTDAGAALRLGARFFDDRARRYTQAQPIRFNADGTRSVTDSVALERWSSGGVRRDTIGYLPLETDPSRRVMASGGVVSTPRTEAFRTAAQWAVANDGRVYIVHPSPYRVDVIHPDGRRVTGAPVAYERIRVTEQHKTAFMTEVNRPRMVMRRTRDGQTSIGLGTMGPSTETWSYPEFLPPFLYGAARTASDGTLWVLRTSPVEAPHQYDVFENDRLVRRVSLPARARLVGFGANAVYLVVLDEDDLQTLQRHNLR
ncbi:MAG: hypothetical protein IPK85_22560 [Gemmatimonadetes bacterium]|nr:hypothetical protein [Gemmatimonadota bacterium]